MPLRTNNETMTTDTVLSALSVVMPANTQQGLAAGTVAINDESALTLDTVTWPALLIMEGPQDTVRINARTWQKKLTVFVFYLAPWTESTETNDQIWADVNADMERIIANLTDNPTLLCTLPGAQTATRNALEIASLEPSPRTNKVIDDRTYGRGQSVVQRMLTIKLNLAPYTGAA